MTALIFVVLLGGLAAAIAYTVSKKDTPAVQTPLPVIEDPIESPGKPDVPEVVVVDYITPEPVIERATPKVILETPKTKTQKSKTVTKKTSKKVTKK